MTNEDLDKAEESEGPQCLSGSIRAEPFSPEKTFVTTLEAAALLPELPNKCNQQCEDTFIRADNLMMHKKITIVAI